MLLVYLTLVWAGGILLAQWLWKAGLLGCSAVGWPLAALTFGGLILLITARNRPRGRLSALVFLFLFLAVWRYHAHALAACPAPDRLVFYNGDEAHPVRATVEGIVVGYPDVRDVRTYYRLRAETVVVDGRTHVVRGDVLVQARRFPEYKYGDRLRATGALQTPPVLDDFDYRAHLARRGIHSLMRRARLEKTGEGEGQLFWHLLFLVKARGSALLNRVLPEPAAALANGMLLGIESGIAPDVDAAFVATGTSHVIVISGSNIALLSGVLMAGLSRLLGKRRAVFPASLGITLYVLLVGADAAALRAGIMGILYIFAIYLGRQSTAYVSLCASALVMLAWNPLTLGDVGFQLSFAATLGLVLFTQPITRQAQRLLARWLNEDRTRLAMGLLNDALIVTLAAQVLTLPLIVYHFGRLSLISLLANFLILPAQPPIMTGGMATLVAGLIWEPLGRLLAVIPWLFLTYTTAVVRLTAAVPFASVNTGDLGRVAALIYIAVLAGALFWRAAYARGWTSVPARRAPGLAVAMLAPAWLITALFQALPDGRLHLIVVPGGDGEAALLITPAGHCAWLWDGRGDGVALAGMSRSLLAGRRIVDLALGPDVTALWPGSRAVDPAELAPGTQIRLGDGVILTALAAGETPALLIAHGRFRALFPPAIMPAGQAALLTAGPPDLRLTVLFAPGPDTGAWPTAEFLAATAPQVILWPEGTTYPPDVAELFTQRGAARVPTDAFVEVVTDGERLWLRRLGAEGRW